VVSVQTVVVVHPDEDEEAAQARAVARHPVPDDGRAVHRKFFYILTGVPRDPDFGQWEPSPLAAETSGSSEEPSRPSEEPAASGPSIPHSQTEYIFVTTRQAPDDGDPGVIAEALWSVEDGCVVLTDLDGRQ
jgi:hypothetical protein